jgi:hypothetical protein
LLEVSVAASAPDVEAEEMSVDVFADYLATVAAERNVDL